ncbi:hypothetical protein B0G76_8427 [Paraburkholderia sp. BL23I1N1]|nr:hypothetical protein B0G76_8427 [Paraburkholderia sp. BL23I1N1]
MTGADVGQQLEGHVATLVETGRYRSLCIARLSLPPLPYAEVSGFLTTSAPFRRGGA